MKLKRSDLKVIIKEILDEILDEEPEFFEEIFLTVQELQKLSQGEIEENYSNKEEVPAVRYADSSKVARAMTNGKAFDSSSDKKLYEKEGLNLNALESAIIESYNSVEEEQDYDPDISATENYIKRSGLLKEENSPSSNSSLKSKSLNIKNSEDILKKIQELEKRNQELEKRLMEANLSHRDEEDEEEFEDDSDDSETFIPDYLKMEISKFQEEDSEGEFSESELSEEEKQREIEKMFNQ